MSFALRLLVFQARSKLLGAFLKYVEKNSLPKAHAGNAVPEKKCEDPLKKPLLRPHQPTSPWGPKRTKKTKAANSSLGGSCYGPRHDAIKRRGLRVISDAYKSKQQRLTGKSSWSPKYTKSDQPNSLPKKSLWEIAARFTRWVKQPSYSQPKKHFFFTSRGSLHMPNPPDILGFSESLSPPQPPSPGVLDLGQSRWVGFLVRLDLGGSNTCFKNSYGCSEVFLMGIARVFQFFWCVSRVYPGFARVIFQPGPKTNVAIIVAHQRMLF